MKKNIIKSFIGLSLLLMFSSCSLFTIDNYDEPSETLKGSVTDVATGEPVLTDQGAEGIRVRITELSYGDNVQHNPDFYCKPDGTYKNTKIFKGEYNIRIDGPFIPIVRETKDGNMIEDGSVTTKIKGTTTVNFMVQPFLKVNIVGIPQVRDGKIIANVKVDRGVSVDEFRDKISAMGDYKDEFLNVTDVQLFVSYSPFVGYRNRDDRWSNSIEYESSNFEPLLGQTVEIQSKGIIPSNRKVFIRAAARINYATPIESGIRRWNYSEVFEVNIP